MRQPSADLFPTDKPIPASQLIGRDGEVLEIAASLENGANLIVAGPRRTGKTSVCDAVLERLRGRGLYAASVDLFRVADAAELSEALSLAVLSNRSAVHRALARARQAGRAALTAAQLSTVLKATGELGEGVELAMTPGLAAKDPVKALDAALALPERIASADGRRLVLFLDEVQEVANPRRPYGDPDAIMKRMRAIFQRAENVSHLFAGSLEHLMRDLFAPGDRAFSGFGGFAPLRPIAAEDWRDGLRARFAADDCIVEERALERLVALGELHPRATMLIAQQTHLAAVQLERRDVDLTLVEQGYLTALERDRIVLEQAVEGIRSLHKHGLTVARRIALGSGLTRGLAPQAADRAVKALQRSGVVERRGRGDYRIVNPLLRRYLVDLTPF